MRTLALTIAILVLISCDKPQLRDEESDLNTYEQALVGEWLAQMIVTQERIDDYHAAYPEGDKAEVAKYHEDWASRPLYVLRFNKDRTVTYLTAWGDRAGPRDEDTRWRITEDGKTLVLTQTSEYTSRTSNIVDGKEVVKDTSGTHTQDLKYEIAADGRSFTDLPLREHRFVMKDSPEAEAAFREPEPVEPIFYAINVTKDDFVGTWKLDLTPTGDPTALRASMSEKEVAEIAERLASIDVRIEIKEDGTWTTQGESSETGTWTFDADDNSVTMAPRSRDGRKVEGKLTGDHKAYLHLFESGLEKRRAGRFKRMD